MNLMAKISAIKSLQSDKHTLKPYSYYRMRVFEKHILHSVNSLLNLRNSYYFKPIWFLCCMKDPFELTSPSDGSFDDWEEKVACQTHSKSHRTRNYMEF